MLSAIESEGALYGQSQEGQGKRVMVEFVSANPTGPMHMGNARGGVLGDTLANVLRRDGYDTWITFVLFSFGAALTVTLPNAIVKIRLISSTKHNRFFFFFILISPFPVKRIFTSYIALITF